MSDTSAPYTHRHDWHDTWFNVAEAIMKRSLCKTQVSAVIVDENNRLVSSGYNGPPKGFPHLNRSCELWCPRSQNRDASSYDDCPALHAEQNALLIVDRSSYANGSIYVTSHLCFTCAKLIANSGLKNVYVNDENVENYTKRNSKDGYEFLRACGLSVSLTGMPTYE